MSTDVLLFAIISTLYVYVVMCEIPVENHHFESSITKEIRTIPVEASHFDNLITWEIRPGVDNGPSHDIAATGISDVEKLKKLCGMNRWCAGFSSTFGTLKLDLNNLGKQSNTKLYVRVPAPPPLPPQPPFSVWPMPSKYVTPEKSSSLSINKNSFSFLSTGPGKDSSILQNAMERYLKLMFPIPYPPAQETQKDYGEINIYKSLTQCNVNVASPSEELHLNTDETYILIIPSASDYQSTIESNYTASLSAKTVFGALRGLETLSQLINVTWDGPGKNPSYNIFPVTIEDSPRFSYRGLMLDSARHFLPVSILKIMLDGMEASKMNVFHWHVTDGQSFPFESKVFPELSKKGSYSSWATYTHDDILEVVKYAKYRGIRVIPEFDMPAHTESWIKGYPDLQGSGSCCFDPTLESSYEFIDSFLDEIKGLFDDEVVHLGGDEVGFNCWNSSATIRSWMIKENRTTLGRIEQYWILKIKELAVKHNFTIMLWHDMFANGALLNRLRNMSCDLYSNTAPDIIVEVWGGGLDMVNKVVSAGYKSVYANPFYLDHIGKTWGQYYVTPLSDGTLTPKEQALVIGGEAAMWGEWVDQTNIVQRVWPRAAAVAELLWSPDNNQYPKIPSYSAHRLHQWRCRMLYRGVHAEPIGPYAENYYCAPL